ncbi:DUF1329 domain-containing protein [Burkholderia pyrrocinia]|uniref:DUF1329 domain-containing protein n=1 Tax=Burkholderia pyrrocinia TaxID=60550 RepID=UPI0015771514|nr:DUF1329 domain-containing protein [Burkholderia pyrrocinia]NTX28533.1 DUF1329 domain-containing protein [Burkholderia pyrrocinia]
MKQRNTHLLLRSSVLAAGMALAAASIAGVTADDLKQLNTTLTPMGAQRAGSADSGVPAWSGKWLGVPPGIQYKSGERYPDPYAGEKPIAVITAQNMTQYADRLTDGQKALFKKYPDTFRMPVYPSHRDFRFDEDTYQSIHTYAPKVSMTPDGNGLKNAPPQVPFPIPKTGLELMWNLCLSPSIGQESAVYDQAVVYQESQIAWGKTNYRVFSPRNTGRFDASNPLNTRSFFRNQVELPLRDSGTLTVGYQLWDQEGSNTRRTWVYNPGTRRVRQAPEYGFDQPTGAGGFRTVDDDRLFNGSGERYDWKIIGKKEYYVPYDNYKLLSSSVKYSDLLTKHHANPDFMRYELHRVWVLQATLKPGFRHIYAKRVLYLDEDTWMALAADNYDTRGQLWRTNLATTVYAYDAKRFYPSAVFYHDLLSNAYFADRLTNEQPMPLLNRSPEFNETYFSPDAARGAGT